MKHIQLSDHTDPIAAEFAKLLDLMEYPRDVARWAVCLQFGEFLAQINPPEHLESNQTPGIAIAEPTMPLDALAATKELATCVNPRCNGRFPTPSGKPCPDLCDACAQWVGSHFLGKCD